MIDIHTHTSILKNLNLKTNDIVNLEQVENKIIITKIEKIKISLEQKFREYKGKTKVQVKEFEWDEPRGKELW